MKKVLYIAIVLLGLAVIWSCDNKSTKTEEGDRPSQYLVKNTHTDYIKPLCDIIQNTRFFSTYYTLLTETSEEAAALYAGLFVGSVSLKNYELDSTHFDSTKWGCIRKGDAEGEYLAYYTDAVDGRPEFKIMFTDSLSFTVSRDRAADERTDNAAFDIYAEVKITDGDLPLEISYLTINYSETGEYGNININAETVETLHCNDYKSTIYTWSRPRKGILYFTISGDYTDKVVLVYDGSYCTNTYEDGSEFKWYNN